MLAEHQEEAVERALLLIERYGGALLADAPGLGKSFVAAAVARRWRGAIDVVVPAGLTQQWRQTLADFEVEARVVSHGSLSRMPFVAQPAARRLLVVDEAHVFRNPLTRRYDDLARWTLGAGVLLVTATPLCNGLRDLHALLQLMARDDALSRMGIASIDLAFETRSIEMIRRVLNELMIRRDQTVLTDALRYGSLTRTVVRHPVPRHDIDSLEFPLVGPAPLLRRTLRRRLESSEAAFRESLRRQRRFYERVLEADRPLTKREYRQAFGNEDADDPFQQLLFWELWAPNAGVDRSAIGAELARLDHLLAAASGSHSPKRDLLLGLLRSTSEPAIVFTSATATARDLAAAASAGLVTARSGRHALDAFRRGKIDVLVATDLMSEGVNLQRAGLVVHYDLPWNPVRLEQRNGRAHRIGQLRSAVRAVYFVPAGDESGIMATVARKNRTRRTALNGSGRGEGAWIGQQTLRPRLTASAEAVGFIRAAERAGLEVPEGVERRHRAGIDRLLRVMAREFLDQRRMDDLLALLMVER